VLWRRWGSWGVASLTLPGFLAAGALYPSARRIPPPTPHLKPPSRLRWTDAWRRGSAFWILSILRSLGASSLLILVPLVWHHRGGSASQIGLVVAVVYAAGMIGNLLRGTVSDVWGVRSVLIGSLIGASASAIIGGMATTGTGLAFWIAIVVWGFTVNGAGAVLLVYGQSLFPETLGLASGLTLGLGNTVGAFGAWLVGAIAQ
jgi:FSR family fosmidomycin resistance protein-like MFS transporter